MKGIKGIKQFAVGAMFGFLFLSTGCESEDSVNKDALELCCGKDASAAGYESCVDDYKATNVCGSKTNPSNGEDAEVSEQEITACCGSDDGSNTYKTCVENYKSTKNCNSSEQPGLEEDEDLKECCGDADASEAYNKCKTEYKKNNKCNKVDLPTDPNKPVES